MENNNLGTCVFGKDSETGIRYTYFGSGKKTMVIVPGLTVGYVTDNAEALPAVFSAFLDEYTVYVFDIREEVPTDYSISKMSEDLVKAIKSLCLKDIYLYGCSMGGMEAMYIAGAYPELVKKLFVASTAYIANKTSDRVIGNWVKLAKEGKKRELTADMGHNIYSKAVYEASEEAFASMADTMTDADLERFINTASVTLGIDLTTQLKNISCPIFVMGSHGDKVMTADASVEIANMLNGALYLYGNEYPHAVYDEAIDFRDRVKRFFDM